MITTLSLKCETTGKKSDTIDGADAAELYFATQRNTHSDAHYTRRAYNERQTVLLTSEDVGTMGLSPVHYQREKRTRYLVTGVCDNRYRATTMNVVLVYTNRGLEVSGKQLRMIYLHS